MISQYLKALILLICSILSISVTAYTPLSDETLHSLPSAGADFDIKNGAILSPILIPRVPGTPGIQAVQRHFVDYFKTHLPEWTIEFQNSTSKTPVTGNKQVPFVNIILTRDPPWAKLGDVGRLALVAHYDSKLTPTGFIGAIDSAAPCAMIIHAARSVDAALTNKWAAMKTSGDIGLEEEKGVQILFLDGEEAFLSWTNDDSLYGARALAETWETTPHAALSNYKNPLDSITLFLLLDLLGHDNPNIPSYFETTHWAYKSLSTIENRLRKLGIAQSKVKHNFLPDSGRTTFTLGGGVQDDHLPFMARGVEILHMIPTPFPMDVWHQIQDDGEHLDMPTVEDWAKMVTAFVGEWMDLEGYFPSQPKAEAQMEKRDISSDRKTELPINISSRNEPQVPVILQFLKFLKQATGFIAGYWGYASQESSTLVILLQLDGSQRNLNAWYEKLRWPQRIRDNYGPENKELVKATDNFVSLFSKFSRTFHFDHLSLLSMGPEDGFPKAQLDSQLDSTELVYFYYPAFTQIHKAQVVSFNDKAIKEELMERTVPVRLRPDTEDTVGQKVWVKALIEVPGELPDNVFEQEVRFLVLLGGLKHFTKAPNYFELSEELLGVKGLKSYHLTMHEIA
ncbi:hypothetical protein NHQ30_000451 [Ciborinia camelliae]|nr:hypothetical protein NHQ30_000451 [Ciborinia camelliae]